MATNMQNTQTSWWLQRLWKYIGQNGNLPKKVFETTNDPQLQHPALIAALQLPARASLHCNNKLPAPLKSAHLMPVTNPALRIKTFSKKRLTNVSNWGFFLHPTLVDQIETSCCRIRSVKQQTGWSFNNESGWALFSIYRHGINLAGIITKKPGLERNDPLRWVEKNLFRKADLTAPNSKWKLTTDIRHGCPWRPTAVWRMYFNYIICNLY